MSEVSRKACDMDKLIEWLESFKEINPLSEIDDYYRQGQRNLIHMIKKKFNSGSFSFSESEGEAAKFREALERARNTMEDALAVGEARYKDFDLQFNPWADLSDGVEEINQALSSTSETAVPGSKEIQTDRRLRG